MTLLNITKPFRLFSQLLLLLLWCSLEVSCNKETVKADCDPSSCCGNFKYQFVQDLAGAKADIGIGGFKFEQPIRDQFGILACSKQIDMLSTYERTSFPNDLNPLYKYRVWGKVYQNLEVWSIGPPYEKLEIRIERIEKVN